MIDTSTAVIRIVLILLLFVSSGCHKEGVQNDDAPKFSAVPLAKSIHPGIIDEASGIAESKTNAGYLWVEQDSGNPNEIFLLSYNGDVSKKIYIRSGVNRDSEDITVSSGPVAGANYVYIAD